MSYKWAHLAVAPDQMTAEFWIQVLQDQGIPAMIHPADAVSWLGVSGFGCRVQVPEENLEAAREVIDSLKPPAEQP
ncbi:MAG: DUF2007 domain-containing protein [Dehalococcoidia bacterium]